jgi:hypothetical protein
MTTSRTRKTSSGGQSKKTSSKSTSRAKATSTTARSGTPRKRASAPKAEAKPRLKGAQVAAAASRQLLELTGKAAEGVASLERTEDGWKVQVEVVEMRRIPDTTDVLALYEVDVDDQGTLEGYHRLRRYVRGKPGEE